MSAVLSLLDHAALSYLLDGRAATHHVAKAAGEFNHSARDATSRARTRLHRLERCGLVEGLSTPGGGSVRWWQITDAGRQAVAP